MNKKLTMCEKFTLSHKLDIPLEKMDKAYDWVNACFQMKLVETNNNHYQVILFYTDPEGTGTEELEIFGENQKYWFDTKEEAIRVANEQKDKYILDHWHSEIFGYPTNILMLIEPLGN